ncbi:MAG TPA: ABC transporter permease subunit [Polyangiaceae bacterium]|jgi:ABC-2 type transport system permease protein
MNGFFAVFRREMLSLWVTPLAWVLVASFLLLQGGIFYSIVVHFSQMNDVAIDLGPVQAYFGQQSILMAISLLLLCPALTMRLFAEERRTGTIEPLLTAPVTPAAVVLGKYAATLATYVLMWAPTLLYVVILRDTGSVDWGVVSTSYCGVVGVGAGYLAVGTLMSTVTQSQLIALMLTILLQFGMFVLGIAQYIFEPGWIWEISAHISLSSQMEELSKGVVDSRRLVFDLTLVALPLFLAVRVVDSWRTDG